MMRLCHPVGGKAVAQDLDPAQSQAIRRMTSFIDGLNFYLWHCYE
jgi:hypothetical protein